MKALDCKSFLLPTDRNLKFLAFFVVVPRRGHLFQDPRTRNIPFIAWNNQMRFGARRLRHCKRSVAFPPWSNLKICNLLFMKLRVPLKERKLEHQRGKKKRNSRRVSCKQSGQALQDEPITLKRDQALWSTKTLPAVVHLQFFLKKDSRGWWWCLEEENVGMAIVGFGDVVNYRGFKGVGLLKLTSWARRFQLN